MKKIAVIPAFVDTYVIQDIVPKEFGRLYGTNRMLIGL